MFRLSDISFLHPDKETSMTKAIELKNISKKFGEVYANKNINFEINYGEVLSLLGENGSGKTTLMNILSGIYFPDEGEITVEGKEVKILSPKDSFALGIGMVHQHFKLVDVFTATENVVLGLEGKFLLDRKAAGAKIKELADKYGFEIDLDKKIYDMSVSEKQTVEIIKILYRGAKILILDEPTAVLTPQETEKLFSVVRKMRADGKAVVIITHKLNEVMEISDRVAILRKGEYVGSVKTSETNEQQLTEMMVGEKVELNINRSEPHDQRVKIEIRNLTCVNKYGVKALDNVSFDIKSGEILGIAGVAGSGQRELLEAVAGLQKCEAGSSIEYKHNDGNVHHLTSKSPREIKELGISLAFVPEDRLGMGLVGNMGMTGNMLIRSYRKGSLPFLDTVTPKNLATDIKERLSVLTPSVSTPVRKLSGGNVQKVLVGREIANAPTVLMTAYAVRGLDINTSYVIYNILNEQKEKGVAVVYVGEDLDVLLALSDRILVLCGGKISGIVDARTATKQQIGALMTKHSEGQNEKN